MKCFYHSDLDGHASAYIVKRYSGINDKSSDFIEINYGQEFPFNIINENEYVFILDWSLNQIENGWEKLMAITNNIVWIDHHKTAIDGCKYNFKGIRSVDKAACVLTWEYYFKDTTDTPLLIKLIGDYDTWKFEYPDTLNLHNALMLYDTNPCSSFWNCFNDQIAIDKIIGEGYNITKYLEMSRSREVNAIGFVTTFEGYRCLVCNSSLSGSKIFDSIQHIDHDIKIVFYFDGDKYSVSLYSSNKNINCGLIAKKYGGGGHIGAAGFQCETLPFKKNGGINESQNKNKNAA